MDVPRFHHYISVGKHLCKSCPQISLVVRADRYRTRRGNQERDAWMRYGVRHEATVTLEEIDNSLDCRCRRRIPYCDHRRPIASACDLSDRVRDWEHLRSRNAASKLSRVNVHISRI